VRDVPVLDDDFNCTEDYCDEVLDRVFHIPNDSRCDNGDPCTVDSCLGAGGEVGSGCFREQITLCDGDGGDGCCPDGCTPLNDGDCIILDYDDYLDPDMGVEGGDHLTYPHPEVFCGGVGEPECSHFLDDGIRYPDSSVDEFSVPTISGDWRTFWLSLSELSAASKFSVWVYDSEGVGEFEANIWIDERWLGKKVLNSFYLQ